MTDVVLVLFGDRFLGLTHSEFQMALERGSVLSGNTPHSGADGDAPKRLLTAEEMEGLTGVPGTWFLGQARRGELPHHRLGKYVRFWFNEVSARSSARGRKRHD